jgi:hypothetical protein
MGAHATTTPLAPDAPGLLTTKEAARLAGVSPGWIIGWLERYSIAHDDGSHLPCRPRATAEWGVPMIRLSVDARSSVGTLGPPLHEISAGAPTPACEDPENPSAIERASDRHRSPSAHLNRSAKMDAPYRYHNCFSRPLTEEIAR